MGQEPLHLVEARLVMLDLHGAPPARATVGIDVPGIGVEAFGVDRRGHYAPFQP
jgi:hypothetical protein